MSGFIPTFGYLTGEMPAPSGTRIAFNQAAVPLGWVQDTSSPLIDCAPRTVTDSSGGGTGGTTAWSGFNSSNVLNINSFTLSVGQMPIHNHTISSTHAHGPSDGRDYLVIVFSAGAVFEFGGAGFAQSALASSGSSTTGVTLNNNGGAPSSITTSYTSPNIKHIDLIIGQKS